MKLSKLIKEMVKIADDFEVSVDDIEVNVESVKHRIFGLDNKAIVEIGITLNGNLPFLFCPDSSADDLEFAICRIDRTPSFKQVANNLFSTSLVITETF